MANRGSGNVLSRNRATGSPLCVDANSTWLVDAFDHVRFWHRVGGVSGISSFSMLDLW